MRQYDIVRSRRKTVTMEITKDQTVLVRAPMRMSRAAIDSFVQKYEPWIQRQLEAQRLRRLAHPEPTAEEIPLRKKQALEYISGRVEHYSAIMGLYPSGIKITSAAKRFGSCNWKKGLCFSWRLMDYDPEAIDYIVVHELAHLKHMNHGPEFHALVEQYMPDWKRRRQLLR